MLLEQQHQSRGLSNAARAVWRYINVTGALVVVHAVELGLNGGFFTHLLGTGTALLFFLSVQYSFAPEKVLHGLVH